MDTLHWAENEIKIRKESTDDLYDQFCLDSALKAFKSLYEDNHSGFSIGVTRNYLNCLLNTFPLTPILESDFNASSPIYRDYEYLKEIDVKNVWQCLRYFGLFKYEYTDGHFEYHDVMRAECFDYEDKDKVKYTSDVASNLIDKMFPVTFPYTPEKYLVCFKNNVPYYIIKPGGEKVEIK